MCTHLGDHPPLYGKVLLLTNCCKKADQEIDLQHPVDTGKLYFHQLEVTIKMFYA